MFRVRGHKVLAQSRSGAETVAMIFGDRCRKEGVKLLFCLPQAINHRIGEVGQTIMS